MAKNRTLVLLPCLVLFFLGMFVSCVRGETTGVPQPDDFGYAVRIALPLHEKALLAGGFFYRDGASIYLVTARHVLFAPTQVTTKDGTIIPFPRQLIHRIRYDKTAGLLSFEGVLSSKERDEMLAHPAINESGRQTVQQLYENSQGLKLKAHTASVVVCSPGIGEFELGLTRMLIKGLIKYHPAQDVAVMKIGSAPTCTEKKCIDFVPEIEVRKFEKLMAFDATKIKLMRDVTAGSAVYVVGFGSSPTEEPSPERKQPLLKNGRVAGKNKELGIIALNCPARQGDSGGLVLEADQGFDGKHFKGIGVMSGLIHYERNKQDARNYSLATAFDAVLELLKE